MAKKQATDQSTWSVEVRSEIIDVSSGLPEPDPAWLFIDGQGHEHGWVLTLPNRLPTLNWVVDETYWCSDCRDDHEEGHWQCERCGEVVLPGTRMPAYQQHIQGPQHVTLTYDDGAESREYVLVSSEDADLLKAAMMSGDVATTAPAVAARSVLVSTEQRFDIG